jgi:hypothetical protein
MTTRTVVKANYKQARGAQGSMKAKAQARGSASYYETRPDSEGERQHREGFTADASSLSREEVRERIEEAEGNYLYRAMLSPGEDVQGGDLEEWARDVLEDFEGEWVAYVHDDQTEHPHVHVIGFTDEKLDRDDFEGMREAGDVAYERLHEQSQEWQQEAQYSDGLEPEQGYEWGRA